MEKHLLVIATNSLSSTTITIYHPAGTFIHDSQYYYYAELQLYYIQKFYTSVITPVSDIFIYTSTVYCALTYGSHYTSPAIHPVIHPEVLQLVYILALFSNHLQLIVTYKIHLALTLCLLYSSSDPYHYAKLDGYVQDIIADFSTGHY